jgi:hypothetical protein
MKKAMALLPAILLCLMGCSASKASHVRISMTPVDGCEYMGTVTDDNIDDLQRKAAKLGGDTAVVIMQREGARSGPGFQRFSYGTYTTAEIYRCSR